MTVDKKVVGSVAVDVVISRMGCGCRVITASYYSLYIMQVRPLINPHYLYFVSAPSFIMKTCSAANSARYHQRRDVQVELALHGQYFCMFWENKHLDVA